MLEDASNASMPLYTILVIFTYGAILLYNVRIVHCGIDLSESTKVTLLVTLLWRMVKYRAPIGL